MHACRCICAAVACEERVHAAESEAKERLRSKMYGSVDLHETSISGEKIFSHLVVCAPMHCAETPTSLFEPHATSTSVTRWSRQTAKSNLAHPSCQIPAESTVRLSRRPCQPQRETRARKMSGCRSSGCPGASLIVDVFLETDCILTLERALKMAPEAFLCGQCHFA